MLRLSLLAVAAMVMMPVLLWFSAPDTASQIETEPAAEVTEEADTLELELIEIEGEGFRSLAPRGWRDVGEGVHTLDDTNIALVQRIIAAPALSWVQPGVKDEMDFIEENTAYIEYESDHYTWQIYTGLTADFDVAYALANGSIFEVHMIVMQVPAEDYDNYYETMFLPVLNAYRAE